MLDLLLHLDYLFVRALGCELALVNHSRYDAILDYLHCMMQYLNMDTVYSLTITKIVQEVGMAVNEKTRVRRKSIVDRSVGRWAFWTV